MRQGWCYFLAKLCNIVQPCLNLFKLFFTCLNLSKIGLNLSKLVEASLLFLSGAQLPAAS